MNTPPPQARRPVPPSLPLKNPLSISSGWRGGTNLSRQSKGKVVFLAQEAIRNQSLPPGLLRNKQMLTFYPCLEAYPHPPTSPSGICNSAIFLTLRSPLSLVTSVALRCGLSLAPTICLGSVRVGGKASAASAPCLDARCWVLVLTQLLLHTHWAGQVPTRANPAAPPRPAPAASGPA